MHVMMVVTLTTVAYSLNDILIDTPAAVVVVFTFLSLVLIGLQVGTKSVR